MLNIINYEHEQYNPSRPGTQLWTQKQNRRINPRRPRTALVLPAPSTAHQTFSTASAAAHGSSEKLPRGRTVPQRRAKQLRRHRTEQSAERSAERTAPPAPAPPPRAPGHGQRCVTSLRRAGAQVDARPRWAGAACGREGWPWPWPRRRPRPRCRISLPTICVCRFSYPPFACPSAHTSVRPQGCCSSAGWADGSSERRPGGQAPAVMTALCRPAQCLGTGRAECSSTRGSACAVLHRDSPWRGGAKGRAAAGACSFSRGKAYALVRGEGSRLGVKLGAQT